MTSTPILTFPHHKGEGDEVRKWRWNRQSVCWTTSSEEVLRFFCTIRVLDSFQDWGLLSCQWQKGEVNGPTIALQIGDGILGLIEIWFLYREILMTKYVTLERLKSFETPLTSTDYIAPEKMEH